MKVLTTPDFPGREIEALGLVFATTTRASNAFKDSFASIKDIWGGRSRSYSGVLEGSIKDIYKDITATASDLGADAIVGFQVNMTSIDGTKMIAFQGMGTAVRFRQ